MPMDLGTRNTLLCDFMHCMTAVSLEMSDEPFFNLIFYVINYDNKNVKGYYGKGIDTYYPCNNNLNFVVMYIRKINNKG